MPTLPGCGRRETYLVRMIEASGQEKAGSLRPERLQGFIEFWFEIKFHSVTQNAEACYAVKELNPQQQS